MAYSHLPGEGGFDSLPAVLHILSILGWLIHLGMAAETLEHWLLSLKIMSSGHLSRARAPSPGHRTQILVRGCRARPNTRRPSPKQQSTTRPETAGAVASLTPGYVQLRKDMGLVLCQGVYSHCNAAVFLAVWDKD